jgi:replicative DNA helicase
MQSSGRTESRQQEISEISRSLKILAKELDVPVIALSQLSRASESRSDKRPMLSDLRESGAIEQDADMVMFLYRDDYYNKDSDEKNIAECIVAKHRNGETGTFKLGWKGEYTKFSNLEYALKEENA